MRAKTVDDYIAACPQDTQKKLQELRAIIKEVAPETSESISYSMPYYGYKGRLVYFALNKHHIGLYIPPPIIEQHKSELATYGTTKSAVHLPLDGELPVDLIKKLVRARVSWNESLEKKK